MMTLGKASKRLSRMTMTQRPYHFVAIVGGAIAGSVAAEILADNGIHVVVIEQNKKLTARSRMACLAGIASNANKSTAVSMLV